MMARTTGKLRYTRIKMGITCGSCFCCFGVQRLSARRTNTRVIKHVFMFNHLERGCYGAPSCVFVPCGVPGALKYEEAMREVAKLNQELADATDRARTFTVRDDATTALDRTRCPLK